MLNEMNELIKSWQKGEQLDKSMPTKEDHSNLFDIFSGMWSSALNKQRNSFNVPNPEAVIYIPLNRLKTPYQTEKATNWDKVQDNVTKMEAGTNLEPVVIGYDYDIHDGHHRFEASKFMDYTHVPCVVGGSNDFDKERAEESYREVWKSFNENQHPRDEKGRFTKGASEMKMYHGTALHSAEKILEKGFKVNGGSDDFGRCAYFKSPELDKFDHRDWQNELKKREANGTPVPERYANRRGNDTVDLLGDVFIDDEEPAVIQAHVPKEHVLDCTNGRPEALEKMIKDFEDTRFDYMTVLKHASEQLLKRTPSEEEMNGMESSLKLEKEIEKVWGDRFSTMKMSPYELYAKGNGIKAIVDKLNAYTDEGWQVGIYDPGIIKITDHGKGLSYTDGGVELLKALAKAESLPYCLLHHEFDNKGNLVLHVGAYK